RDAFYQKELELRLSRSYGPGRYDPAYEEKGSDYPAAYVRWTEQRNLSAFLGLLAEGRVRLEELVTQRFPFSRATEAYELLAGAAARSVLGVVLEYPAPQEEPRRIVLTVSPRARAGRARIGMIGAGSFATGTMAPLLQRLGADLRGIVSAGGLSARSAGERFGFAYLAGEPEELIHDPEIDAIIIATRHGEHARLAAAALRAGKAVFVEKPLALDEASLEDVVAAAAIGGGPLMVGFNRRFAPATRFLAERLRHTGGARVVHARVNAGAIPAGSWVHDPVEGGGRLLGEGCHFIDLVLHLAGSPAVQVEAVGIGGADPEATLQDNVQVTMRCADGSLATVLYTSKGEPRAGKERVELFAGGASGVLDDFRRAEFWKGRRELWRGAQDKGHAGALRAFVDGLRGGHWPIPLAELEASTRLTIAAAQALQAGSPIRLGA
ncbi:MAG TPA: Gfo/Idh/MocA family oxidoreductase, partial [Longimicrobiales bacterium]